MKLVDTHGFDELKVCNWTWIDSTRTGMTEMLTGHETRTLDIAVDTSSSRQIAAATKYGDDILAQHGKLKNIWMNLDEQVKHET